MAELIPSPEHASYSSVFPWGSLDVSREAVDKFGLSPYMVTTSSTEQISPVSTRASMPSIHISIDTTESLGHIPLPNDDEANLYIPVSFSRKDPADLNRVLKLGKPDGYDFPRSADEWDVRIAHALGRSAGDKVSENLFERLRSDRAATSDRRIALDKYIISAGVSAAAVEQLADIDNLEARLIPGALVVSGIAKLIKDKRDKSENEINLMRKSCIYAKIIQQDVHNTICKGHAVGNLEQKFKES